MQSENKHGSKRGRSSHPGLARPFLVSLEVNDKDGAAADTALLEFDDSYGRMILPPKGASVSIDLEGINVFRRSGR